ncbi:hypothetical protein A2160_05125 [Candidatus Beckwithbacteria bacterium RBG_13_42_9]|uniref:Uncharacterized protein n=1 Tax=Candidatus Beckwithbacteria bacterium RBG_13_42_9 TaxID=1797457 RepID=A0A1F5E6K0_9BACT|nr:MAG: hypothetical protein A2160_05125 [Candidatus Beckwithbacteria bacterium RBG_13_42_9]
MLLKDFLTPADIEAMNGLAPYMREAVAQFASENGYPISSQDLPLVVVTDGPQTRANLLQLAPRVDTSVATVQNTPLGQNVLGIRIHPLAIAQRAEDLCQPLGGEQVAIEQYVSAHDVSEDAAKAHLANVAYAHLVGRVTLATTTPELLDQTTTGYMRILGLALDLKEGKS